MTKKSSNKNKKKRDDDEDVSEEEEVSNDESSSDEEESEYEAESSEDEEVEVQEKKNSKGKDKNEKEKDKGKKNDKKSQNKSKDDKKNPAPPATSKGKGSPTSRPEPVPENTTPITNDPFHPSNQIRVLIPFRFTFNPMEAKGLLKIDIKPYLVQALEDAHLATLDKATNTWVKLVPTDLRYFVTSLRSKGLADHTLPYPIKVDVDVPIPEKTHLFLGEIHKLPEKDRERVKRLNTCVATFPVGTKARNVEDNVHWTYTPKLLLKDKVRQYGNVMMGAKPMWGEDAIHMRGVWLVRADSEGVRVLLESAEKDKVRPSVDNKGYVLVPNEQKVNVDKKWTDTIKSWGMLATFGLKDKEQILMTVGRSDVLQTTENIPADYWTNLSRTTSSHHDSDGKKDILNKNHDVDLNFMMTLGAPLSS